MNRNSKYLLLAVIVTTIIANYLSYGRYQTTAISGKSARTAIPIMNLSSNVLNIELNPEKNEQNYRFDVSNYNDLNRSEVSMTYNLQIKTENELPLEFEVYKYDDNTQKTIGENLLLNNFTKEFFIDVNQKINNQYILKIKWKENEKNYLYSKEIDYVQLVLNSKQVD